MFKLFVTLAALIPVVTSGYIAWFQPVRSRWLSRKLRRLVGSPVWWAFSPRDEVRYMQAVTGLLLLVWFMLVVQFALETIG
jgi:hypothetical protein